MTRAEANRHQYKKLSALNWLFCIAAAALMVVLIFTLWFTGIKVADDGMAPALYKGDVILFDKMAKHISHPVRGEAYAFQKEGAVIGRIAALPGDTVAMKEGRVYIGGKLLKEPYASESAWELKEFTLPAATFLILPDDRTGSMPDKQELLIPFDALIGRASVRVSPIGMTTLFLS
ncbi:MAG: signal peptidase I [Clostridia bacterium]|nr:signal peptidase I [Clostridia bacterium]